MISGFSLLAILLSKGIEMPISDTGLSGFNPSIKSPQILSYHRGIGRKTCLIQSPAEYDIKKAYPLVIALHGWTEERNYYFRPWEEDGSRSGEYPCFYLAPNNGTEGWDSRTEWIEKTVSQLIDNYPIDANRIYIIGFSMGGSGSFAFAENLYRDYGIIPAAIVRCAGMSRPVLSEPLFSHTAIWYSVGSQDTMAGVLDTFHKSERYYSANIGSFRKESDELDSYKERPIKRTTLSLMRQENGNAKFLFSLYSPMGHEYGPVFASEDVYTWLFKQSLSED